MRRNITTVGPDKKQHTYEIVGYFPDDAAIAAHVRKVLPGHKLAKSELVSPAPAPAPEADPGDAVSPAPAPAPDTTDPNPPPT